MHVPRGKMAWVIRLVCALVVMVAGVPLRANASAMCRPVEDQPVVARPAVSGPIATKIDGATACCSKGQDMAGMACASHEVAATANSSLTGHSHGLASDDDCKCKIDSGVPAPPNPTQTATSDDIQLYALVPALLAQILLPCPVGEPCVFGIDSGPPPTGRYLRDFGRAPPVARA